MTRVCHYLIALLATAFTSGFVRPCVVAAEPDSTQEGSGERSMGPTPFPIMTWDAIREPEATYSLQSIAECGFTYAGFVAAGDIPLCEKLGLRAIVSPGRTNAAREWFDKTPESKIEGFIKDLVEKTRSSPAVMGYFITDEPNADEFPKIAVAAEAVVVVELFPQADLVGGQRVVRGNRHGLVAFHFRPGRFLGHLR